MPHLATLLEDNGNNVLLLLLITMCQKIRFSLSSFLDLSRATGCTLRC